VKLHFDTTLARLSKAVFITCLMVGSVQESRAGIACPTVLYDGNINQDGIALTFINIGKVPIRQLELYCTPSQITRRGARSAIRKQEYSFRELPIRLVFLIPSKALISSWCRHELLCYLGDICGLQYMINPATLSRFQGKSSHSSVD
jgi:hypothetical protein